MWKAIVNKISCWLERGKYKEVDELYHKTFNSIKESNNKLAIKKSYHLIQKLEKLTFEKHNNPQWMVNRNNTIKLLWLHKFKNYRK